MLPLIGGVVAAAASVGYVFKYRIFRSTRNEELGQSGKQLDVKLVTNVDGPEEEGADDERHRNEGGMLYHEVGFRVSGNSSDMEEIASQDHLNGSALIQESNEYDVQQSSSDRSMVPPCCTAEDSHTKLLAGENRFHDLQRLVICSPAGDERVVQELQNDSKQQAHKKGQQQQQGEWWELPDLRFELHGIREDQKEQEETHVATDHGLRCFQQGVDKQNDESEERVVGCVDEMPKDGSCSEIRLQQNGEDDEDDTKCEVERSQVLKLPQEIQRQTLEAEHHPVSISKNPEKGEIMLSSQEIASCEKSLLEHESWEERLQQERDVANVKHKEEMQGALEAQKLELEEMWQKQLENKQKQWEEMQAREMEQVCRSLQFEWEGRMHREIASDRVRHEVELGRRFKLALEAQTLRLGEDYAQQLEEMREKEDRKWMQKLLMEREGLLAMAKTVLAQERENWRVSQEAEWRIMLAKERVQWEESEQQKDMDENQKNVDACVKKETARLVELHSANLESKEMQLHQATEEVAHLRAELAVVRHQLEALQGRETQSSGRIWRFRSSGA
jgi:hypothetical protein